MKKLLMALCGLFALGSTAFAGELIKPSSVQEFNKLTVRITNDYSGGTGVILKSTSTGSYVLTNKHICDLSKEGDLTVFTYDGKAYRVEKFKPSSKHDLCLVKVAADLKYNSRVAAERSKFGDAVTVTGHPYLYPTMVKQGHMSGDMTIEIITEWTKCTKDDYEKSWICSWYGELPVISTLESQTASFSIAGGNSGSAVFNSDGEIVGVVYAGSGKGMSPAILVPHEYILNFVKKEIKKGKWQTVNNSYVYGRESSRNFRSNNIRGTVINDTKELMNFKNLAFPAIKSNKLDRFINIYNCLKEGSKLCFTK